jgi:hypothetical protein
MWTPALRLLLVAAASATAGWLGSTYLRARDEEAESGPPPAKPAATRDERLVRTSTWCEACRAHMPLEHSCDTAGVRKVASTAPDAALPNLAGDLSAG